MLLTYQYSLFYRALNKIVLVFLLFFLFFLLFLVVLAFSIIYYLLLRLRHGLEEAELGLLTSSETDTV